MSTSFVINTGQARFVTVGVYAQAQNEQRVRIWVDGVEITTPKPDQGNSHIGHWDQIGHHDISPHNGDRTFTVHVDNAWQGKEPFSENYYENHLGVTRLPLGERGYTAMSSVGSVAFGP